MHAQVRKLVVVGGGSAGWLTAAVLAATHAHDPAIEVTVIESPQVATVGVGEGTWPSMRETLRRIGVGESDFIRACDATFKQGSQFNGWIGRQQRDAYMHPFTLPNGFLETDLVAGWLAAGADTPYAEQVSFQPHLCAANRAPKQPATPEFAAVANYAYHLDAAKFGQFLRQHCVQHLGVRHLSAHVNAINSHENGDIASLQTRELGAVEGDLFIDCSGARALLLEQHFGIGKVDLSPVLFNDRALAVQVPYPAPDTPIACQTIATAQPHGWTWDIGLSARRGVGYVYASAHCSDDQAHATLLGHIAASGPTDTAALSEPARIAFAPGYRRQPWHRNCVAIGMASGFVEPLEASSLVLVELGAAELAEQLPATREDMDHVARRYNEGFDYRWQRVADFLKLHYVLSQREDSDYWRAHRDPATSTERLREWLALWRHHTPSRRDLVRAEEVFPSASYHYILYGMDWRPELRAAPAAIAAGQAADHFRQAAELARRMRAALPSHRQLIAHIQAHGLPRI
ncbi:tryptophan halogenase family protein [Oleiagrimonas sp. C23AA]|uniref:tryptophan 7-halogenase n=1 Tax=Oleiagrimonas sp. C23AA TaxID=2719047 RepID=UPI00141F437E|nr:tryptophan 7-halogenase [Oleiagrimonas sp. C23AA]